MSSPTSKKWNVKSEKWKYESQTELSITDEHQLTPKWISIEWKRAEWVMIIHINMYNTNSNDK